MPIMVMSHQCSYSAFFNLIIFIIIKRKFNIKIFLCREEMRRRMSLKMMNALGETVSESVSPIELPNIVRNNNQYFTKEVKVPALSKPKVSTSFSKVMTLRPISCYLFSSVFAYYLWFPFYCLSLGSVLLSNLF